MDHEELISMTRTLGGLSNDAQAERAVEAVLETLGERLTEAAAVRLATFLPVAEAGWLLRRRVPGSFGRGELTDRVGRREGARPGFAIEHVLVVCEAMATLLPPEELEHVRQDLSPDMAELFTRWPRASQPHPGHARTVSQVDHSLAGARQGSRNPLSEARPLSTRR